MIFYLEQPKVFLGKDINKMDVDEISLSEPSDEEPELSEKGDVPMYDQEEDEDDRLEDAEEEEEEEDGKDTDAESDENEMELNFGSDAPPEDTCYQQYVLPSDSEEDLEGIDSEPSDEEEEEVKIETVRRTKPFITKYEKVRILSFRANQLSRGAAPMLKDTDGLSPAQIALKEYEQKVIPLKIKRPLPNGTVEKYKISELTDLLE